MRKITLLCMFLFAGLTAISQTTHNLDWYMGITSADASLTIDVGDTVIWTFTDAAPHSVTSDAGSTESFDSGTLSTGVGTTYSYTFTTAGTNPYHCAVHPSMVGTITVNALPTGPANDDLANATPLTIDAVCSGDLYDNTGATAETGEPSGSCFNDNTTGTPDNSVWFSFVAPAGGNVSITTDIAPGVLDDSEIAVYGAPTTPGDPSTLPTELGCNQDGNGAVVGSGWMSILDLTGLVAGNTYYIQVDGYGGATGAFCIEVRTPPAAPVNDNLANATALTLDAVCSGDSYTNFAATAETGEPTGSCFNDNTTGTPDNSVWFSFVAPTSGAVNISTDIAPGVLGDSEIAVYGAPTTPGDPSTLPAELGCNQDGNGAVVGSGWMSILDLTGLVAGNTYYIQVDGYGGATGAFCIVVNTISCSDPSALTASNITPTTADLDWTENGTATTWDVQVVTAGSTAPTATTTPSDAGVTTNPYNKTGLTANTAYDFYVRADCGSGSLSAWVGPFTFTTACATLTAPWFDDLETQPDDTSFTDNNCWTATATTSYDWNVEANGASNSSNTGPDNPYSGSAYFYIEASSSSAGDIAELYSPMIDVTALTTPALKFYYHLYGSVMGELHIDVHDGTAWVNDVFTLIGEQQTAGSDPWLKALVDLSAYTGTIQIRFRAISAGTYEGDISLDDISVIEMPTCFVPNTLTAINILATSADLGWTDTNTPAATTWDVHVVPANDPAPTATTTPSNPGATTNPYTVTGLIGNTNYDFYVRSDCGGGDVSIWAGPFAFTTACPAAFVPAYLEDFAANVAPDCWEESGNGDPTTGPDTTSSSSDWTQDEFGNTGTNQAAKINLFSNVDQEWLISPTIDLSAGGYELVYNVAVTDYANTATSAMGSDDQVQVLLSTDNGATWSNVLMTYDVTNTPSNTGQLIFIDLAAYTSATTKIAFWATDGSTNDPEDYDFFIDDFEVRVKPSCSEPSALTAASITATTADLSWTENGTATTWDVHVVLAGDPAPTATTTPSDAGVASIPYNKTGLTAQTSYDFYVRADCGGGDLSSWAGPFGFATPCVAATIPYTESFTSGTFPGCWTRSSTTDVTVEATCDTRSNVLNISDTNEVVTGPIDGTTTTTGLKVSYYIGDDLCGSPTEDPFEVEYWDGTQWVLAKTYIGDGTQPYENAYFHDSFIVPISAVTASFKLRFSSNETQAADNWYIDDVMVEDAPSCLAPTTLTATSILATSADLGWTDTNTPAASTWDVHVVLAGDPAPTATTTPTDAGVTANPYNKIGLIGNTNYEFYVRTDCGGGTTSSWEGPFTFKTLCAPIAAPWFDDLEMQPDDANFTGFNCWSATATGAYEWNVEANGSANSTGTGPDNPYSGVAYFYTEASSGSAGDITELYSPMIDVTALTAPALKFYYHMFGSDIGELHVDVHDGTAWVNDVFTIIGQQQTAGSDPWLDALVDLSAYTGTIQIRFRAISAGTYEGDISLDDISVIEMPTCLVPTTLTATAITTTSADLGWTDTNTPAATTWDVHVVLAGDPAPTATTTPSDAGVTTSPYNKTGLTSGTTYEFYVRSDCGGGTTSIWAGPFMFSTLCTTATLPYSESFTSGVFPTCWTRTSTTDVTIEATCDTRTNVLNISDTNDVITGDIDGTSATNGLIVSYFVGEDLCGGATEDPFEVSYWDGTQWVLAKTYLGDGTQPYENAYFYDYFIVPQSVVTATFRVKFSTNETFNGDNWYIDDFMVDLAPTCLFPDTLTASNLLANSADLGWTDVNTPAVTTWDVHVVLAGDPAPTATTTPTDAGVTANPYTKTGLTPQTTYEFYVRTDCGGGDLSAWAGPFAFTTACLSATLPYTEDFTSGTFPTCWERSNASDVVIEATCGTRSNVLRFDFSEQAVTGNIDATTASELEVSYYIAESVCGNGADAGEKFNVDYWDGTQWVNAMIYDASRPDAYTYESFKVPQSALTAGFKVRFDQIDGSTDSWFIDSLVVKQAALAVPTDLMAINIQQTAADLTWTENGFATEWEVEYGPVGFAQGSGTLVTDNDGTLGVAATGLTAATQYDFYVRSFDTFGNASAWAGPKTFTSACASLNTFPYTESFEDTSTYRVCWSQQYVSGDEVWEYVGSNQNGTITPRTGALMADFSTTNPSGDVTKLVTVPMDLTALAHPQLEFYFANVSWLGDIDELRVYYKTSATGTWTQIGMDYTAEHTTWTKVTLSLPNPSSEYYVAFEGTSNYGRGLNIDDVWIGEGTAACEAPSNLTTSNVSSTSADLSWDPAATGGPFEYQWAVFATGADPDVDTPIVTGITAIGVTTATATGLTASTPYDFYVRTICVPGTQSYSDIAGPKTFSTTFGIEDQVFEDFSYYPNPVNGTLSLKASQEIQQVVVYDLLGQEVLKNNPNSLTPTLNFHNLQTGTYLMKVTINGAVGIYRVVKE